MKSKQAKNAYGKAVKPAHIDENKKRKAWSLMLTVIAVLALTLALSGCAAGEADEEAAGGGSSPPVAEQPSAGNAGPESPASDQADQPSGNGGGQPSVQDPAQNTEPDKPDQYQTSAVPAGKPQPVEPKKTDVDKKTEWHCTLTISAETILDNMGKLDPAKTEVLPEDGIVLSEKTVLVYEGETVFDVLLRGVKEDKIHMEFTSVPLYNSKYIEGIGNLYEYDCGELSGWMYQVNGWFPNYGCSRYQVKDGDRIEWLFTCDLGRDIGGDWEAQNAQE